MNRHYKNEKKKNGWISQQRIIHSKIIFHGCPLFLNLQKIMLHSSLPIFESSYRNFSSHSKRSSLVWKFPVTNTRAFLRIFKKNKTTSRGSPKVSMISYVEFPFPLIFVLKIPAFSVEYFAFSEIVQLSGKFSWKSVPCHVCIFQIFRKFQFNKKHS